MHTVLGSSLALRALVAVLIARIPAAGLGHQRRFSVIGSVATVALALALGFNAVIAGAGLIYAIGVLGLARFCRGAEPQLHVQPMAAAAD